MELSVARIVIMFVLGGGMLLAWLALCMFLFHAFRQKTQHAADRRQGPEPMGQPVQIRGFSPADKPIASSARWDGSELVVQSNEAATKCLFDAVLQDVDQCMLTYRFRIKTDNLARAVYPEMWCRIPERGQFFSRGLRSKVRGTNDWVEVKIPFFLEHGQAADRLQLNLIFEGAGVVRMKEIEIFLTQVKPAK
jgi:hypothetical protein